MMEIAATHHLAFSNNVFTDVIRESSFVKQKAYQVFKQASDDCNFLSSSMKQIEAQAKVLTKKRDAALKKNGPDFVDPKLVQELEALSKKHESAKAQALQLEAGFKSQLQESFSNVKDDVRKSFVHFISLLKNIEYDLNAELEKFDKDELTVAESLQTFESLPVKEITFEFEDLSRNYSVKTQSLTDSMISMLGFNNVDIDAEGSELVGRAHPGAELLAVVGLPGRGLPRGRAFGLGEGARGAGAGAGGPEGARVYGVVLRVAGQAARNELQGREQEVRGAGLSVLAAGGAVRGGEGLGQHAEDRLLHAVLLHAAGGRAEVRLDGREAARAARRQRGGLLDPLAPQTRLCSPSSPRRTCCGSKTSSPGASSSTSTSATTAVCTSSSPTSPRSKPSSTGS